MGCDIKVKSRVRPWVLLGMHVFVIAFMLVWSLYNAWLADKHLFYQLFMVLLFLTPIAASVKIVQWAEDLVCRSMIYKDLEYLIEVLPKKAKSFESSINQTINSAEVMVKHYGYSEPCVDILLIYDHLLDDYKMVWRKLGMLEGIMKAVEVVGEPDRLNNVYEEMLEIAGNADNAVKKTFKEGIHRCREEATAATKEPKSL